eukprot:7235652-Pyramimonas_sp.AAC.1
MSLGLESWLRDCPISFRALASSLPASVQEVQMFTCLWYSASGSSGFGSGGSATTRGRSTSISSSPPPFCPGGAAGGASAAGAAASARGSSAGCCSCPGSSSRSPGWSRIAFSSERCLRALPVM